MKNQFPKLHNATWPGVVGKGHDEPFISLDKMIEFTAKAEVNGRKFDGVDLFLSEPQLSIDSTDSQLNVRKKISLCEAAQLFPIGCQKLAALA